MRYSLSRQRRTNNSIETMTVGWDHYPSNEEINGAVIENYKGRKLNPGETLRAHRFKHSLVIITTGPPTWWSPHLKLTKKDGVGFLCGWLRIAIDVHLLPKRDY